MAGDEKNERGPEQPEGGEQAAEAPEQAEEAAEPPAEPEEAAPAAPGGEAEPLPQRGPAERAEERAERRRRRAVARRAWRARRREKRRAGGPATTATPTMAREGAAARGRPRVRQGIVVSDKPDKTITVRIDITRQHRAYKKIVRESSTLRAHDERNEAHAGDTVRVVESRPLSRTKRWRLVQVLERAR